MVRLGYTDPNSYAEPGRIVTKHSSLQWKVDFVAKKILGSVTHKFKVLEDKINEILLDVRDVEISNIEILSSGNCLPVQYFISKHVENIGSLLTIELPEGTALGELIVRIDYETSDKATALQWLKPEQTLGKQHPYMFSQCQAIHARSIMPCQDTPAIKFTYEATIEHPTELTALMSALVSKRENGKTTFKQDVPIPAYLLAIAIGKLVSRSLGPMSNVWAEEGIIEKCAEEFSDTPEILKVASDICGPYVWKQYDLLVMPPSFPYGGMENPCLTFVTPTLLAGDKSLVDVIAHEIAHSWTGNLVTNKNFEHFWLNEGFTVYVESKIIGRMRGKAAQDFFMMGNITELKECLRTQLAKRPELSALNVDLSECSPDDAFSSVPYYKGSLFLYYLENLFGGPRMFEEFLRWYLNEFAYQSLGSDDFRASICSYFIKKDMGKYYDQVDWDTWFKGYGMPPVIPKFDETLSLVTKKHAELWATKCTADLKNEPELQEKLDVHQLIDILAKLIEYKEIVDLTEEKIKLLESTYNLKDSQNAEVRFRLMRLYIMARLSNYLDDILSFLNSNFRMKYCRPIYRELAEWPEVKPIAIKNFESVKNQMMSVCSHAIANDLGMK